MFGVVLDDTKVFFCHVISQTQELAWVQFLQEILEGLTKRCMHDFQLCQMRLVHQILEEINKMTAGLPDLGPMKQVWCMFGVVLNDMKVSFWPPQL
jgi:hypothetical protein